MAICSTCGRELSEAGACQNESCSEYAMNLLRELWKEETDMNVDIKETYLEFGALNRRLDTDMIVIHHTGENDIDASAAQIHEWHKNKNPPWAGIGYHFVIRKDGTIERGRPEWAVGSHAYGENSHTLGIHLSGDFMTAVPTDIQIDKCAMLIAYLCDSYEIPTDCKHIVGHGELMATSCPGTNLQALLDDGTIVGKANWYRYGPPAGDAEAVREAAWQEDLHEIQQDPEGNDMARYNTIEEVPEWGRATVKKMIEKGLLSGNGTGLDLSRDMLRVFVVNDRAGIYDSNG